MTAHGSVQSVDGLRGALGRACMPARVRAVSKSVTGSLAGAVGVGRGRRNHPLLVLESASAAVMFAGAPSVVYVDRDWWVNTVTWPRGRMCSERPALRS
jgi:hypothetical protein